MVQLLIMDKTNQQFDHIIGICRNVFVKKMKDYGTAWRILRPKSMTDQIYIKAQRIRSIEEKVLQKSKRMHALNLSVSLTTAQWH